MCGRYILRRINLARAALDALPTLPFEEFSEHPRFNIATSQYVPLVRLNRQGKRVISLARWGPIPSWQMELPKIQPINARAEQCPRIPSPTRTQRFFLSNPGGNSVT